MSTTIRISEKDQCVEVIHRGSLTVKELEDTRTEVAKLLVESGLTRLLVNSQNADVATLSMADIFNFNATHASALSAIPLLRFALVIATPRFKQPLFSETVARNRGVNLRVFLDPNEARQWLAEGKEE